MTLTVERDGPVTTLIRSRIEARNAMDPASAEALTDALARLRSRSGAIGRGAVRRGRGVLRRLRPEIRRHVARPRKSAWPSSTFPSSDSPVPRGPMGPTPAAAVEAGDRRDRRAGGRGRHGARAVVRPARDGEERLHGRLLPPLGRAADRRRHRAAAAHRRAGQGARHHPDRPQGAGARSAIASGCASALVPDGESRAAAEALAHEIARFPQGCMRADRRSVWLQEGLSEMDGLRSEWACSAAMVEREGAAGAARFAAGKGRHGDFGEI